MFALLLVACSVGLDNFGAATAIGVTAKDRGSFLRIVVAFGIFEGAMPVVGILLGRSVAHSLGGSAHLLAGATLCAAGLYTAVESRLPGERKPTDASMGHGRLAVLAAVLSFDNLVIGFALGAYRTPLLLAAVVLGGVSALLTWVGLELGRSLRGRLGTWSELVGAALLVGVGIALLAGL